MRRFFVPMQAQLRLCSSSMRFLPWGLVGSEALVGGGGIDFDDVGREGKSEGESDDDRQQRQ